jgi:hypothetical protein
VRGDARLHFLVTRFGGDEHRDRAGPLAGE